MVTRTGQAKGSERQVEALRLHDAGLSYSEIGDALGISKQGAHKLVSKARRNTVEVA